VLRTRGHTPAREAAVAAFSRLGEHGLGWYAAALVGEKLDPGRARAYRHALRAVALAFAANQAIKFSVRRRRPALDGLPPLVGTHSGMSYPSAHAATSFAAAHALPWPGIHLVAAAMALSRPWLGVHYPSDTLAGVALGTAVSELVR
jgi:undecaprenyl-diphosphatase